MNEPDLGLTGALQALFGGAGTALFAAALGRMVYHGAEVRAGRRPMFGWHLVWEVPTAVIMALVAESIGTHAGLAPEVTTGVVAVLSYLGPRGAREVIERIFAKPKG